MIRHLPLLDHDRWYVIDVNHGEDNGWPSWRHRGLWLHGPDIEAHAEWTVFGTGFGLGFSFGRNGGESDLGLDLHLGRLSSLYLRLRAPWTKWAQVGRDKPEPYLARKTGLVLFPDRGVFVRGGFEEHDGVWERGQPWWRSWSLSATILLGKTRSNTETTDTGHIGVTMPEGTYVATWSRRVTVTRYVRALGTWRDRLLGPRQHTYVDLEIDGGIPIEGKGENSWDCGMDGLFAISGRSVEDAIGKAVGHVLEDRKRHGGPHHLPRPMTVAEAGALP